MSSSNKHSVLEEQPAEDHQSCREKIKKRLQKYDVGSRYTHIPLPKASVLLPLFIRQGKLHLLLTVRSMKLKTMPGDVCFPGGRREASDQDDVQTALREANEEIGLCSEKVQIIGRLIPYIAKSPNYLITPVVGIVEDTFEAHPDPNEVTDVFLVPLEFFISSDHYTPIPLNVPYFGLQNIHSFQYEDKQKKRVFKIWGLTAHFALMLAVMILQRGPAFNCDYDLQSTLTGCEIALLGSHQSKL
ncbi:peroxisomal coenzyme A diphosphatase NUDT7 [Bombina bombina]|uniref:peroxisomal coenzyme A diphosphatase NUDT7 n=1 Tax=Bombina bombina TaxID=8345 RepID=UPI00235B2656|nr:peroxisomal coenzyme A diphosphatase NUDT7 [Bombina bombina]